MISTDHENAHFPLQLKQRCTPLTNGFGKPVRHVSGFSRISVILSLLVCTIILGACTNSKLIIGPLYNRLDDQIRGEFHKLGDFNSTQVDAFEQRLGSFHVWHRQSEMPKYAELLRRIRAGVLDRESLNKAEVTNWINVSEGYTQAIRMCHPANYSFSIMQSLTDEQIDFIEKRFASERRKNFNRYQSKTKDERRETRVENVVKWASRIGFDFTKTQRELLDETFAKQVSLRNQYYKLVHVWNKELFTLARNQASTTYEKDMATQVAKLWTLVEKQHPEQWGANRQLWRDFAFEFVETLNYDQRVWADTWLGKMAKTIDGISQDTPSFQFSNDPKLGCTL